MAFPFRVPDSGSDEEDDEVTVDTGRPPGRC
jgi:hypothetical protein